MPLFRLCSRCREFDAVVNAIEMGMQARIAKWLDDDIDPEAMNKRFAAFLSSFSIEK